MNYQFGVPGKADGFASIVARSGDLRKITRSSVTLLAWWRDYADAHGVPGLDLANATACFEYPVSARCPECGGRGKDSFTDVMVLTSDLAVAFEAKYTEPRYETVDEWLKSGDLDNRKRVLNHWCHIIGRFTGHPIESGTLGAVVYQAVHRTASACAAARPNGSVEVNYLLFEKAKERHSYEKDLLQAAAALDPSGRIRFATTRVKTAKGSDYSTVEQRCEAAPRDGRADILSEALINGFQLYKFETPRRHMVSGK